MLLTTPTWTHLGPLVGRVDDLDRLRELVEQPGLVTVTGPGGVGKTRLVGAMLDAAAGEQPMAFVDLDDLEPGGSVAGAVARVLVGEAYGAPDAVEAIVQLVRAEPLLLVLDAVDPDRHDLSGLLGLRARCPRLRLVVTAVRRLGVQGERLLDLAPLAVPASLEDAPHSSAVQLLVERLAGVGKDVDLDADLAALVEICTCASGLPLALELVVGWAAVYTLAEIASLLGSSLHLFSGGGPDLPERQRDLRSLIGATVGQLDLDHRTALATVAAMPGGIDHALLVELCGPNVLTSLRVLVERHLVVAVPGESSRFDTFHAVRMWALGELDAAADEARRRLHDKVCEQALAWGGLVGTRTTTSVMRQLERLEPLHRSTIAALVERHDERAPAVALALVEFWCCSARVAEGLAAIRAVDGDHLTPVMRAELALAAAQLLNEASDDRAGDEVRRAAAFAAGVDDPALQLRVRIATARAHWLEAEEDEALAVLDGGGDAPVPPDLAARVSFERAIVLHNLGRLADAAACLSAIPKATSAEQDVRLPLDIAGMALSLAIVGEGALDAAIRRGEAALQECDWPFRESVRLRFWLTSALLRGGRERRAGRVAEAAVHDGSRIGGLQAAVYSRVSLGVVLALRGERAPARREFLTVVQALRLVGNVVGVSVVLSGVLEAWSELGIAEENLAELLRHASPGMRPGDAGLRGAVRPDVIRDAIATCGLTDADVEAMRAAPAGRERSVAALDWLAHELDDTPEGESAHPQFAELSARELEVLGLIADGHTDQQIADRLVLGVRTVNTHVLHIRQKLGGLKRRDAAELYRDTFG